MGCRAGPAHHRVGSARTAARRHRGRHRRFMDQRLLLARACRGRLRLGDARGVEDHCAQRHRSPGRTRTAVHRRTSLACPAHPHPPADRSRKAARRPDARGRRRHRADVLRGVPGARGPLHLVPRLCTWRRTVPRGLHTRHRTLRPGTTTTAGLGGSSMVLICCRCQLDVQPTDPYDSHVHDRATGAPYVTYSHSDACPDRYPIPMEEAVRVLGR